MERRRQRQLACEDMQLAAVADGDGEIAERSGLTDQLKVSVCQPLPCLVVPEEHRCDGRPPHPTQLLSLRRLVANRALCVAKNRHGGDIAVAEKRRQTVEQ